MKSYIATLIALSSLFLPSQAPAALSGFYSSAEQINLMLSSSDVADALRQAPIGFISNSGTAKDGAHEWTITTQECDLKVYIKETKSKGPGKSTFAIARIGSCD